ncbi:dihydroorotate dehydrogenase electron transfer subunit [Catenibacillus scindens]|uniref:Dihydroorotate dehydrogenase B (NAD(+)), electron transfer subunit n=1 Tax=Catenibacillus scindens TaxID=673271 RepID=A0A7W8H977_9FIRM|nr:dihydroorotate dehydrogenase electron transfer subunit [Catenibacillus scindens]MBB5264216.1 dihydroorotate dehydrogenase electron transfer subunit [Catenibacillus scindens]
MSIKKMTVTVNYQKKLAKDVYSMWLAVGSMADEAKPGQFISIYSNDSSRLLPRPISICEVDREFRSIRVVYRVVGAGTEEFSHLKAGQRVSVMGPLGNGYTLKQEGRALLVAGGIGIPPMLELAKNLDCEKDIVLGYKDSQTFLASELEDYGNVYIATEDGSVGTKGNVMDAIRQHGLTADKIYSCGPTPMLRAVKDFSVEKSIECEISLEEKMACGIGACLACVCKSKDVDAHTHVNNKRICKDGPVFNALEVEL